MSRATAALLVVLVGCAAEESSGAGTNPPTLWLAMSSGSQMRLVGEEPRPY